MSRDKDVALRIIARGERVILRGWLANDSDYFVRWLAHGEWRLFDAPWEEFRTAMTAEDEKRNREWFMQQLKGADESWFSGRAVIAAPDNTPLGKVILHPLLPRGDVVYRNRT